MVLILNRLQSDLCVFLEVRILKGLRAADENLDRCRRVILAGSGRLRRGRVLLRTHERIPKRNSRVNSTVQYCTWEVGDRWGTGEEVGDLEWFMGGAARRKPRGSNPVARRYRGLGRVRR